MRHRNTTKTFGRSKSAREAMLRDVATSVIVYEKIKTTQAKAKAARSLVETLITTAKAGDLSARRTLLAFFPTEQPVQKLMDILGPRYKNRNGGYTRIIKIGSRLGDAATVVQLELV